MEGQTTKTVTPDEEQGVKMIQFLQNLVGIEEPEEIALLNWRNFSNYSKEQTKRAFVTLGGPFIPIDYK
jgi:hypothetical protein